MKTHELASQHILKTLGDLHSIFSEDVEAAATDAQGYMDALTDVLSPSDEPWPPMTMRANHE